MTTSTGGDVSGNGVGEGDDLDADLDDDEEFEDDEDFDDDDEDFDDDDDADDELADDDDDDDDEDFEDDEDDEDDEDEDATDAAYEPGDVNAVAGEGYEAGDVNTIDAGSAAGRSAGATAAGNGGTPVAVLDYLAQSMADDPEAVVVRQEERRGSTVLRLHVAPGDMGRVIGRRGRTAQAIRTLVAAAGARDGVQVAVDIVDD